MDVRLLNAAGRRAGRLVVRLQIDPAEGLAAPLDFGDDVFGGGLLGVMSSEVVQPGDG